MECFDCAFDVKKFPNVFAAYGNFTGNVIEEMSRYVKGTETEEKITSLLGLLEQNLEKEKDIYNSLVSI